MWIRTQDKSMLLECSVFKVEKHTQCSKERCEDKIAEKYKLRRLPRNNYYYAFSASQLAEVGALYNAADNVYYTVKDSIADGNLLAVYSTEADVSTVMSDLECAINNKQVFQFPADTKVDSKQ